MIYRNKLTGAEFATECEINAENYEAISSGVASPAVEEPKVEKKAPTKKKGTKK